ncbi:MAG: insulinase family protein [Clostridia bacterium]|nr:insulinase family protein [Clostridia bacterium]
MDIKEIRNDLLGEKYYKIKHTSGLDIYVFPKENYSTAYAVFGTKYGSIDTIFKKSGEADFTEIPEGIAHFLEHKLFESEELDAFERFAKTGASANAYTSFDKTCYLFSCSGNFKENLDILLDFVRHPYFTQQTVEKEQGIIGQEIRMYRDVPDWRVLFNLLCAMYKNHPVRIDIAGTEESISHITADLLYKCYNTFYNLNNMALAVAGNVTVEEVIESADRLLTEDEDIEIERKFVIEEKEVVKDYIEEKLSVASPIFSLGFKETWSTPERTLKEELLGNIILEAIAGNTSDLYKDLIDKELINPTFSTEYFTGYGYSSMIFSGESRDPKETASIIKAKIREIKEHGINKEDFERARKKLYGREIMSYNDVDELANNLIAASFMGEGLFDEFEMLKTLGSEDADEFLTKILNEEYSALSVILPA